MTDLSWPDLSWIGAAITTARPQAVAALLRYFRNLDNAEEAFQEASLRALKTWSVKGPPRNPAAWLILVGRNAGLDGVRRQSKQTALPPEEQISDLEDAETDIAERLDGADYRDDILRLLFICAHPEIPPVQQVTLALRIVCGLTVPQIARAFLVGDSAMEQRITRAKARIATLGIGFDTPGAIERSERLAAVMAMVYLLFNEGYTAPATESAHKNVLCGEAIRLMRLLMRLFPTEPEVMGLTALILLQHSRFAARFDSNGRIVLLEDQDRALWDQKLIQEGLALIDKAMRHKTPGAFQIQAAIAALHARAVRPEETDWAQIDRLYATLERLQPSPVITLNRAVVVSKLHGPQAALDMIEALDDQLAGYFYYHGATGIFQQQLGHVEQARTAFNLAIACAGSLAEADHIRGHLDQLEK